MKTEFRESFLKALAAIKEKRILAKIKETIELVERADSPEDILHLKKMHGSKGHFRVRIGDYRIGLKIERGTVYFFRCLDRKDIYRFFR